MAKKTKTKSVDRRNFLKTAAASAALAVTKPGAAEAQQAPPAPRNASAPVLARPAAAPAAVVVDEAKIARKPALVGCHGTVGAQHATMGVYDAFCDRVPMVMILGNIFDAVKRGTGKVAWVHSAQDAAALVRDMTKWDDAPHS